MNKKAYMGIDPGKNGAVCIIYPEKTEAHKCPDNPRDMADIVRTFLNNCHMEDLDAKVCIEKVHVFPTDGKVSAFTFGTNYGMWQGILGCWYIDFELVRPVDWQKSYNENYDIPKIYIEKKRKFKEIAKNYVDFNVTLAIADSILIAKYLEEKDG